MPREVPFSIKILFQGDSITDAGRDYTNDDSLGTGYVTMVVNHFSADSAKNNLTFINRGVAGDKIKDLRDRWQIDCLNLKPDVVSILVGINDVVGKHFWRSPTPPESFEEDYRLLLEQTRDVLKAKIVLLTPFIVYKTRLQQIYARDLNQKLDIVKKLSREFETLLIPLDLIFEEATKNRKPACFSGDGIHPTAVGHSLIAESWLKSVSGILA